MTEAPRTCDWCGRTLDFWNPEGGWSVIGVRLATGAKADLCARVDRDADAFGLFTGEAILDGCMRAAVFERRLVEVGSEWVP